MRLAGGGARRLFDLRIAEIAKAPWLPQSVKGNRAPSPGQVKDMLAAAATAQKRLLEASEPVGERFADEARAIHLGEAEARAIHGRATPAQAESLIDEGVPIAPLPFPVADPGTEN